MSKSRGRPAQQTAKPSRGGDDKKKKKKKTRAEFHRGVRETVESIVIAVVLAFLFRAFEAEAFVIPTGSMAPTLQGRHVEVQCEQCGIWYRTGASNENADSKAPGFTDVGCCPVCRYPMVFRRAESRIYHGEPDPNQDSFNGDRIIVSKFAYIFGEPQRWDVIVFKYPANPKQNYIKRLIGLPGEAIKIRNGDIYARVKGEKDFTIARKSPQKTKAMLQVVDDTDHVGRDLIAVGWPSRWQEWSAAEQPKWNVAADRASFAIDSTTNELHWLRYRHLVPSRDDWQFILSGELPPRIQAGPNNYPGQLITDYYPYNFSDTGNPRGKHWVGDLAVECDVTVKNDTGVLLLDLVEGGVHFTCEIDVATGKATVSIGPDSAGVVFSGSNKHQRSGPTTLQGAGNYHLRFSNLDNALQLWVNERVVRFDNESGEGGIQYYRDRNAPIRPHYAGPQDPGDAEPIGIGSKGVAMEITGLRVFRDVFYEASKTKDNSNNQFFNDRVESFDYMLWPNDEVHTDPSRWSSDGAFDSPAPGEVNPVELAEDQFFPLGDNSPSSQDARIWFGDEHFVRREFLTGKAVLIYWPHSWRKPIPLWPNFKRMNFIR